MYHYFQKNQKYLYFQKNHYYQMNQQLMMFPKSQQ
jgi:hypothetical protein